MQAVRNSPAHSKDFKKYYELGYRFIASGSDAVLLNNAARSLVEGIRKDREEIER